MQSSSTDIPPPATTDAAAPRARFPWPAVAACELMLAWAAWVVVRASRLNDGRLIYPLDDLYIHLAAVKQLVLHGVWGVSYLDGFSSCLSSLLYPLLLAAATKVFGLREWMPLALNLVAAAGSIFYAGAVLARHTRSAGLVLVTLAAAVVFTPLSIVAATGMEHVWQILVDLFFVDMAVRTLAADGDVPPRRAAWLLPLAACLAVMIRFEGLFIVSIVGLLLLCRGRFWLAVSVGVGAALPLVIFGWISVAQGWAPLPNSVLLKGGGNTLGHWAPLVALAAWAGARRPRVAVGTMLAGGAIFALVILVPSTRHWLLQKLAGRQFPLGSYLQAGLLLIALVSTLDWAWRRWRSPSARPVLWLGVALVVTLQHLAFSSLGWVYRYEAYLMFVGVTALGVTLAEAFPAGGIVEAVRRQSPPARAVTVGLTVVVGVALLARMATATRKVETAAHNVYEQQYQMAKFVQQFYDGKAVAANDIGAITYYADIHMLDTYGLASYDVFQARRAGAYNQEALRGFLHSRGVQLIVVYDVWASIYGGILPEWVLVGRWQIPNNVICASDTVSFYAPDASLAPPLTAALQGYARELPADVTQSGPYVSGPPLAVARHQ